MNGAEEERESRRQAGGRQPGSGAAGCPGGAEGGQAPVSDSGLAAPSPAGES